MTVSGDRSALSRAQRRRKASLWATGIALAVAFVAFAPTWPTESLPEEAFETAGLVLIGIAVVGRTWCTLYIGGRKRCSLVQSGPYSLSRHPLYVFSVVGAFGIGLTTGSLMMGTLVAVPIFLVLDRIARREEAFLAGQFPTSFAAYCQCTPRWLSLTATWRDEVALDVRPRLVAITFRDASLMLLAVPLVEVIEALRIQDALPIVAYLP